MLHFERPVGRAQHYLGSTFEQLLETRMRSHAKGRGSRLTAAAIEGGGRVALAAVWPIFDRSQEKEAKKKGHYKRRCVICGGQTTIDYLPIINSSTDNVSTWNGLQWPGDRLE